MATPADPEAHGAPAGPRLHSFHAVAFAENFSLKDLASSYGAVRRPAGDLHQVLDGEREAFLYPFGVIVFHDVDPERREEEIARLRSRVPGLSTDVIREDLLAREDPQGVIGMVDGVLVVDRLTPERAGIVALTVAQSASMEYYEGIVVEMFTRTGALVDRLEKSGSVPYRTRPLHKFIGEALGTRTEVMAVLHLLDKPDATWDDPAMGEIYEDLRGEFDLGDRYESLELKLRSVQESLELVLDVARDRRLVLLEVAIVALIVLEIALSLLRGH